MAHVVVAYQAMACVGMTFAVVANIVIAKVVVVYIVVGPCMAWHTSTEAQMYRLYIGIADGISIARA